MYAWLIGTGLMHAGRFQGLGETLMVCSAWALALTIQTREL